MVLDSIYWECTGGHESTKLNYQLFRKWSASVIVIVGSRMEMESFSLAFFPMILCVTCGAGAVCWHWRGVMRAVKKHSRSCQRLEVKSNSHHSFFNKENIQFARGEQMCSLQRNVFILFYRTFFDLFSKQKPSSLTQQLTPLRGTHVTRLCIQTQWHILSMCVCVPLRSCPCNLRIINHVCSSSASCCCKHLFPVVLGCH